MIADPGDARLTIERCDCTRLRRVPVISGERVSSRDGEFVSAPNGIARSRA
jgi:hypothetical protein